MKRSVMVSLIVLFALVFSATVFSGGQGAEVTTVTLMHYRVDVAPQVAEFLDNVSKEHPNIKIDAQVLGNYEEGFKTRRAADELADLIMIRAGAEIAVSAGGGYLMDITNEPVLNKVADASLEATRFQGKQWMVPTVIYCAAPFYNEDIFADHAMTLPTYWEELLAVCDKFKAAGIIPVTWELATTVNTTFASWEFFGAVIGKDTIPEAQRIYKGQGSFAEWPAFLKAVDRMMLFAKRDYLPPDAQGMNFEAALQYFALGNSAMMTTGAWHTTTLRDSNPDANLNVFPWPANDKGTTTIIDASTEGFAIDHDTEHKTEALTVLDWLTEPKNSGAWALMMGVQSSPTKGVTFPDIPETKTLRTLSPYAEQMFPVRMDQCEGVPPALGRDTTSKIFEAIRDVMIKKGEAAEVAEILDTIIAQSR